MSTSVNSAVGAAAAAWGWSPTHQESVRREYERFLDLAERNSGVPLVPAKDIDLVWHEHIRNPAADRPPPLHDTHSTVDHEARFAHTVELYRVAFGEPNAIWSTPADCNIDQSPPPPSIG